MYQFNFTKKFRKTARKNFDDNKLLEKALVKSLSFMQEDPFHIGLKTHKVDTILNKDVYSSRITGDWRIIWQFDEELKVATILCLELGTHSGANQVYQNKS